MRCDEVRALAPELALNIASGEQRAAALAHITACPDCREALEEMSRVADGLLLLAPAAEPPTGFETRVLEAQPVRPRRWAQVMAAAAAVIAIAGAAAGGTWALGAHDRHLAADQAAQNRELGSVDGRYFTAAPIRAGNGQEVGQAFGYDGSPSWVYVVGDGALSGHRYRMAAVLKSGRTIDLGSMQVGAGHRAWGTLLPVPLDRVASLRMVGRGWVCTADLTA